MNEGVVAWLLIFSNLIGQQQALQEPTRALFQIYILLGLHQKFLNRSVDPQRLSRFAFKKSELWPETSVPPIVCTSLIYVSQIYPKVQLSGRSGAKKLIHSGLGSRNHRGGGAFRLKPTLVGGRQTPKPLANRLCSGHRPIEPSPKTPPT